MPITTETKESIFSTIKKVLQDHCPPLVEKQDKKETYEVIGNIPAPYRYKKEIIPGMFFAAAVMRKDNVSFYFFCNYIHPEEFQKLAPTAMMHLDGKSCFHFKKEEQAPEKELRAMVKKGITLYKREGWIK